MEQNWNEEHIKEYLNYAYLEIGDTFNIDIKNPFKLEGKSENIAEDLVRVFKNTDYLPFTVKTLMNMNLFPYQMSILDTLWNKRLPMILKQQCLDVMLLQKRF